MLARGAGAPGPVPTAEKPAHQRPELPDFWDHRFRGGVTPWDAGGVPQQLAGFAARQGTSPRRTLIPGCGSAWEARHLDALGWPVDALDFSPAAIERARQVLADFSGRLLCADFFSHAPETPYEVIYERAFLCALPRNLWPGYAPQLARMLGPGGLLAGYFFIDPEALRGPPFGIARFALEDMLSPFFELVEEMPATDSIGPFAGREWWMVWRRR